MDFDVKEIAKELAPQLEEIVKSHADMSAKELKETTDALKKDIAEIKVMSKKGAATGEAKENFQKVGKFFKAVAAGDTEGMKTMSEGTDADGGYLVHPEFHKQVVRVAEISGFARKFCTTFPMGNNEKNVTSLSSGATSYVVGEGASITASSPTFGQKVLVARKFAALIKSYQELIDDNSTDEEIATLIAKIVAESLAELEDAQVLTGSGTGLNMPGILTDTNVNIVTMATGDTSFADVNYAYLVALKNAVKMKYKKASKGKIVWAMSQDVFNHIESLVDANGRPLFRESLTTPDTYTLLGYPIEFTEVMPDDGDDAVSTKFLAFGAFAFYALGDRKQITTEVGYSSGGFEKDEKSFKATERVAGINLIPAAFSVLRTAAS